MFGYLISLSKVDTATVYVKLVWTFDPNQTIMRSPFRNISSSALTEKHCGLLGLSLSSSDKQCKSGILVAIRTITGF